MSKGHLTQLIQQAKTLLVEDPDWWRSFRQKQSLSAIKREPGPLGNKDIYEAAAVLAKLEMITKWTGPVRNIEISADPDETQLGNKRTYSSTTRRVLTNFIKSIDWANQQGSDTPVDAVKKELKLAVKKAGGTAIGSTTPNRRNSKVTTTIRRGELAAKLTGKDQPELDLSIFALLNAKLPPAVRANMVGDALHNRTGRFSESVKVVGVEETPQGFPRLLYTYQRAPYDVFDPVLGALPWATPERDPKKLIDKSIRDVAKELVIQRFYTRRA